MTVDDYNGDDLDLDQDARRVRELVARTQVTGATQVDAVFFTIVFIFFLSTDDILSPELLHLLLLFWHFFSIRMQIRKPALIKVLVQHLVQQVLVD